MIQHNYFLKNDLNKRTSVFVFITILPKVEWRN